MKVVKLDQAVAEDNYYAPNWWVNFTADIMPYDFRHKTKKRLRVAEWLRDVNQKLLNYGGQLQKIKNDDYILYFRIDSNLTYFLLKYEHTPKESEWWS